MSNFKPSRTMSMLPTEPESAPTEPTAPKPTETTEPPLARMKSAPIRASTRMTTCGGDPCGADEPPMSPVNSGKLERF